MYDTYNKMNITTGKSTSLLVNLDIFRMENSECREWLSVITKNSSGPEDFQYFYRVPNPENFQIY